jgi:hypothetical protein
MNEFDPYQPPVSDLGRGAGMSAAGREGTVPPAVVELLRQTKPWVTFLAIMGFIGAGLIGLAGLAVMAFGAAMGPKGLPWPFGLVYILLAVFDIFPSLFLFRYGASIRRLLEGGGVDALTDAIARQKSFWRLVGITTVVILGIYGLVIVGGIVVGVIAAASR